MIFIDTTWVSAADRADKLHVDGPAVLKALAEERLPKAITTGFVLDETLTILRSRVGRPLDISNIADDIVSSSTVRVQFGTSVSQLPLLSEFFEVFLKAWQIDFSPQPLNLEDGCFTRRPSSPGQRPRLRLHASDIYLVIPWE